MEIQDQNEETSNWITRIKQNIGGMVIVAVADIQFLYSKIQPSKNPELHIIAHFREKHDQTLDTITFHSESSYCWLHCTCDMIPSMLVADIRT